MAQPYYPPAQPYYRDPTDVMGRRIGAFFIDAAIVVVLAIVTFFAMAKQVTLTEALRDYDCSIATSDLDKDPDDLTTLNCDGKFSVVVDSGSVYLVDIGPYSAVNAIPSFLYFALLQGLVGGTLGKLATGIRVVTKDTGELQGIGRAVVRWLFFLIDGPFTLYICGLVTSLVSKGHRRVGDMVAGTFVVGKEFVGQPPIVGGITATAPYGPPPGYGYGPPPGYPVPPGYPAPPPGYPAPPPGYPAPPPGPDAPAPAPWGAPPPMGPPAAPPGWPIGPAAPTAPAPSPSPSSPSSPPTPSSPPLPSSPPTDAPLPLPPTAPSEEPTCPQPPPASPTGVPAWDRERGAWMQWDPSRGSWMVWNPAIGMWVPA